MLTGADDLAALEMLRELTSQNPDNIMLLDRDERIQFINWTVSDLTIEQVLGTQPYDYLPEPQRTTARDLYRGVLATGEPGRTHMDYVANDGTVTRFELRASPFRRDDEIVGVIALSTDVTERAKTSADRDRFFDLSLDMLCVGSLAGSLKRVNRAVTRILGWSQGEMLGRPLMDLVHPEDVDSTTLALGRLRAGDEVVDFVNRYQHKDGGYRTLSWKANAQPELDLVFAVARDVTERHALELRLRQSQKLEAIGQLAGGIAHDFNNLLLALMLNVDLARRHASNEQVLEHLQEAQEAGQRAADLTRQLLTFSRQQPVHPDSANLNELVSGMLRMLRRTIPEHIELDFIPGHKLPRVHADIGQIEQVLLNLCLNARDALPDGGRIAIETEAIVINGAYRKSHPWARPGRYVLMTVTDNGVGMTAEVRERIFEPFFTTKEPGKGTGLGLAMTYGIVHQHDGFIHVYSEPGKGTAVKTYLPVALRKAEHVGSKLDETAARGGNETILVVEDAPAVRNIVVKVLETAGYDVVTAEDGMQAVQKVRSREDIALALVDIVMPKMSGPEAATEIRKINPSIAILFTSGYTDAALHGDEVDAGSVVPKPYEPDLLMRRIRDELDRLSD